MNDKEDKFFDDLDAHMKILRDNPNEINEKSYDIIYCLLNLCQAALNNTLKIVDEK